MAVSYFEPAEVLKKVENSAAYFPNGAEAVRFAIEQVPAELQGFAIIEGNGERSFR